MTAPIGHLPKEPKARVILSDPTPIQLASKTGGIKAVAMNCGVTEGNIHHYLKAAGNLYTNNEKCKCLSSWAIRNKTIQSERHWIIEMCVEEK